MAKSESAFWKAYRDPRWQRRRLEIMQAADFKCEECGDKSTTLNVHHRHYRKGHKPWEYEDCELRCLCEPCHEKITELLSEVKRISGALSIRQLEALIGTIREQVPEPRKESASTDQSKSYQPLLSSAAEQEPYDIGDVVQHSEYGLGQVTSFDDSWDLKRVKIRFPAHGEKTFVAGKVRLKVFGKKAAEKA